jgi:hypothetical protein
MKRRWKLSTRRCGAFSTSECSHLRVDESFRRHRQFTWMRLNPCAEKRTLRKGGDVVMAKRSVSTTLRQVAREFSV